VAKPPKSTPHSDIEGVHRDEKPNVVTAQETGEASADLRLAAEEDKARPPHSDEESLEGPR
jgi:hypothetical protein